MAGAVSRVELKPPPRLNSVVFILSSKAFPSNRPILECLFCGPFCSSLPFVSTINNVPGREYRKIAEIFGLRRSESRPESAGRGIGLLTKEASPFVIRFPPPRDQPAEAVDRPGPSDPRKALMPTKVIFCVHGVISPVIANMALDGLEAAVDASVGTFTLTRRKAQLNVVRYVDDFVVTGVSKDVLESSVSSRLKRRI